MIPLEYREKMLPELNIQQKSILFITIKDVEELHPRYQNP